MLDRNATPAAAVFAGWANQMLVELQVRFLPELSDGVRRVTSSGGRPNYAALVQACAALEAAVDTVDFQLTEARGLLGRLFRRRQGPALAVFQRQLSNVANRWEDVRSATAAISHCFAAAEHAEKRAFLQIGLTVKDFQPQFAQLADWLDLASQQPLTERVQLERISIQLGHFQLAEARARLLLEELQRVDATRTLLTGFLTTELARSVSVWEIRTGELLEQHERGESSKSLVVELMPHHIALRRLVHKVGATCDQLQHQEESVREIAREMFRAPPYSNRGTE